jgi:hypothetical protein
LWVDFGLFPLPKFRERKKLLALISFFSDLIAHFDPQVQLVVIHFPHKVEGERTCMALVSHGEYTLIWIDW